ncbi:hypothetical protein WISP_101120 [Willisornis vidua]|uniref:Uncharacterized protein n=1 Tax=Willisornis vidua TaxID=1566151 RepID=A0ABQ9D3F9_9PASS|nr:hypothetical protein WISP_101120 [Willisornis vidua]
MSNRATPAGSKKAKSISSGGSPFGITDLRRRCKRAAQQQAERGVRKHESSNSASTEFSEGGTGGAPGARVEVPLQPMVQIMVRQLCPCSPWRSMGEMRHTCSPWRTPSPGGYLQKYVTL